MGDTEGNLEDSLDSKYSHSWRRKVGYTVKPPLYDPPIHYVTPSVVVCLKCIVRL